MSDHIVRHATLLRGTLTTNRCKKALKSQALSLMRDKLANASRCSVRDQAAYFSQSDNPELYLILHPFILATQKDGACADVQSKFSPAINKKIVDTILDSATRRK